MDDTKQEILSRIDALAAKLGTTAEYLWQAMCEDVAAKGAVYVALWGLLAGVGVILLIWSSRMYARGGETTVKGTKTTRHTTGHYSFEARETTVTESECDVVSPEGVEMKEIGTFYGCVGIVAFIAGSIGVLVNISSLAAPRLEAWKILTGG